MQHTLPWLYWSWCYITHRLKLADRLPKEKEIRFSGTLQHLTMELASQCILVVLCFIQWKKQHHTWSEGMKTGAKRKSTGTNGPLVGGIHGCVKEGAFSIMVSGGYPEDVNKGGGSLSTLAVVGEISLATSARTRARWRTRHWRPGTYRMLRWLTLVVHGFKHGSECSSKRHFSSRKLSTKLFQLLNYSFLQALWFVCTQELDAVPNNKLVARDAATQFRARCSSYWVPPTPNGLKRYLQRYNRWIANNLCKVRQVAHQGPY